MVPKLFHSILEALQRRLYEHPQMLPTTSTRLSPKQDAESAEATDLPRNLAVRQPRKPVQVGPLELSVLSVFNHDREFVVLSRDPRTGQDTLDDVRRRSFALNEASDVAVVGIRTGTGKACEVMDTKGELELRIALPIVGREG